MSSSEQKMEGVVLDDRENSIVETSVKANDVFVVSSEKQTDSIREKPCAKPRCKKRRVSSSKGTSTSSESVEDGECTKSDGEHEDGEVSEVEENTEETKTVPKDVCITNSEQHLLREFRKMKADVEKMKTDNSSFGIRVKTIVKEVVAEVKGKWMKEVVELVQKELKFVNDIEGQVYDIEKSLKEVVEDKRYPTNRLSEDRVRDEVLERMEMVESQVIDLEARGRRNNLIIHGLEEADDEDCRHVVNDFIDRGCCVDERVVIERVHRIGKRRARATRPRPMIVKFLDYQEKQMVKAGAKHLSKEMYMTDDFPYAVRQARKELAGELSEAWKKGMDAYIRYPAVLVIGGIVKRTVQPVSELDTRHVHTETDNRRTGNNNTSRQNNINVNNVNTENPWTHVRRNAGRHNTNRDRTDDTQRGQQRGGLDASSSDSNAGRRGAWRFGRGATTSDGPRGNHHGNRGAYSGDDRVPPPQRNRNTYRR